MRVFVAIDMPDHARDALERLQDDLPVGRLMAPDTFHLTLAFLGEHPEPVVAEVHEALCDISAAPFPIRLHGVDVFGGSSPKLLWAGVDKHPALADLRERVRRAVIGTGVELSRERFRPHVTLARFSGRMQGDEAEKLRGFLAFHAGFALEPFIADRFTLYRSVLHSRGAMHEVLAEYQINGS